MSRPCAAVLLASLAVFSGCATPAVVMVSKDYQPRLVRRVALLGFRDYPGMPGSGEIAAGTFDKYLLLGDYSLVERREVGEILREQAFQLSGSVDPGTIRKVGRLLGVDAVALGSLSDFSTTREQTVIVDMPRHRTRPIYGRVVTTQTKGDTTVRTEQDVVTGYDITSTTHLVPRVETLPARVGMSVRLVDVETAQVLWSASSYGDGSELAAAAEEAASKIMQAVAKQLAKR